MKNAHRSSLRALAVLVISIKIVTVIPTDPFFEFHGCYFRSKYGLLNLLIVNTQNQRTYWNAVLP
jgi:hypothetical protein